MLLVASLQPKRALVVRSDDGNWVWALVLEPGSLIMERKMLLGIKARAERLSATGAPDLRP